MDFSLNKEEMFDLIRSGAENFIEKDFKYNFQESAFSTDKVFHYNNYTLIYNSVAAQRFLELSITDGKTSTIDLLINTYTESHLHYSYFFTLEYLEKFVGIKDRHARALLDNYKGTTLSEKINSFFIWLDSVMDERLENILCGKDWVDIPFDWGPYK